MSQASQVTLDGEAMRDLMVFAKNHDLVPSWEYRSVGDFRPHIVELRTWGRVQVGLDTGKTFSMAAWRAMEQARRTLAASA